ncbi:hypothetical protein PGANDO_1582, partial [Porphyromonas gingivalis]
SWNFPAK